MTGTYISMIIIGDKHTEYLNYRKIVDSLCVQYQKYLSCAWKRNFTFFEHARKIKMHIFPSYGDYEDKFRE